MSNVLSLRKAHQQDRDFLLQLRKASMTSHLKKAGIVLNDAQHFERIDEFFEDSVMIEFNNQPIGLIKLAHFYDRLHIRQFQILPTYQNQNVGSKVLNKILLRAQQLSKPVTLNVLKENPAKRLYDKFGFQVVRESDLEYFMSTK